MFATSPLRWLVHCLALFCLTPAFGQQLDPYFSNYDPQWSPDGEKILFFSHRAVRAGVYVMDKDGAHPTRLTQRTVDAHSSAWSPNGKKILYLSEQEGISSLFVTDPSGSYHQKVSPLDVRCLAAAWSPDGNTIAIQGLIAHNRFSGLFLVKADGSDWLQLAAKEERNFSFPRWTPDGREIVCVTVDQYGSSLRAVDVTGTRSRIAVRMQGATFIQYAPTGSSSLLSSSDGLYLLPDPGSRPVRLYHKRVTGSNWSRDGKSVLYITSRENGKNAVFVYHLPSGAKQKLLPDTCTYANVSFSPDGKELLYNCDATGSFEIYTANADGTHPKQLTYFQKPSGNVSVTIYYNRDWRITKKEAYRYSRKASLDTNRTYFDGPFEDYDSTGRLMLTGTYLTGKKNGPCTVYHLNGKKDSHGNFLNNAMQGKWEYHYPNGKLKQEIEFKDSDYRILSFYDSLGNQLVTDGTGNWYDHFGENQQRILLAGKVVNGFREGQWRLQDHTQALLLEEEFREGKFVSGTYYPGKSKQHYDKSLLGKSIFEHPHLALAELLKADNCFYGPDAIDYILGNDPFKDVDPNLIASFPGGDEQFAKFMAKNLRFPTAALQRNGESRVIVEFIVDETGRLSNFKIRQGVTTELNFEAVRVMKLSPPWFPARLPEGTPQKARVAVPVLFRVETRKSQ